MTNKPRNNEVSITSDEITLRFGDMEPVVIPRASLGTRLRLLDWVYRLTAWPGMNVQRLGAFIGAVFRHHGWGLPEQPADDVLIAESTPLAEPGFHPPHLAGAR